MNEGIILRMVSGAFWLLVFALMVPTVCFADAIYWENKAPMPTARSQAHSAVVNGKLYVLGGQTGEGVPPTGILNTVERYDPASDVWQTMPPLSMTRVIGCSVAQGNYIYIVGGGSDLPPISTTVLRYDTTTGASSVIGNINHPRMRSGCEIINNKIYVVGGSDGPGPPGFSYALNSIEVFDLNSNTVTETVTLPTKMDLPTTASVGTKLYLFGGYKDGYTLDWSQTVYAEKTCWVYDTSARTFTPKSPLLIGMGSRISAVLPDGKIYLNGGLAMSPPSTSNVNTVAQIYDPATDSWTVRSGEPVSATGFSPAAGVINNRIYVVGGNNNGTVINTNRSGYFQPATDTELVFQASNSVTAAGVTLSSPSAISGTLAVSVANSGIGTLPSGVVSQYFDLATSADFTGGLNVTIPYNKASVAGNESNLKLYHWNGSAWDNITTWVDTLNGTITGTTSSLSPFVVAGANGSSGVDAVTISMLPPGAPATATLTGTTLNLGIPQGLVGPTGLTGLTGPAGSPDTQSQILGKIAAAADSTVLTVQQGPTEAGSEVKFSVKNSAGITKTIVTAEGKLGINTSSPSSQIEVAADGGPNAELKLKVASSSGGVPNFFGARSGGSLVAPTPTPAGKGLFVLGATGYSPSGWTSALAGLIGFYATEEWTNTSTGTDIRFATTSKGTVSRAERIRISDSGNLGIGTTAPTQKLEVNGGVRINTSAGKPTCDSTNRGTFWFSQGGSGAKDSAEVCAKDAANTYAWRTMW